MSWTDVSYNDLEQSNLIPEGDYLAQVISATLEDRAIQVKVTILDPPGGVRRFRFPDPAEREWSKPAFFRFLRACGIEGAPSDTIETLLERLNEVRPEVTVQIRHTNNQGKVYDNVSLFQFRRPSLEAEGGSL